MFQTPQLGFLGEDESEFQPHYAGAEDPVFSDFQVQRKQIRYLDIEYPQWYSQGNCN